MFIWNLRGNRAGMQLYIVNSPYIYFCCMLLPKKNKIIYWFMSRYEKFLARTKFQQLLFNTIAVDEKKSVLVLANHFSLLGWLNNALRKYRNV